MSGKKISIVIPAYNESEAIAQVVEGLKKNCSNIIKEIIVVDDGSSDSTALAAEKAGARVIKHNRNMGYGAAIKSGVKSADSEFILTIDGDGQHGAEDALRLWEHLKDNDMVVGQRNPLVHSQFWRMPGKWLISELANYLLKERIPDLNSGFRIFRKNLIIKYIHICPHGFSFSTTLTMILFSRGHKVAYVPIRINKRIGKSTVSVSTGLSTIILVLRIAALFNPLRIFLPLSLLMFATGAAWGVPYLLAGRGISVGSLMMIIASVLSFGLGVTCDQISQLRLERFE